MTGIESAASTGAASLLSGAKQAHGQHQKKAAAGNGIASSLETANSARSGSDNDAYAAEAQISGSKSPGATGSLMDLLA